MKDFELKEPFLCTAAELFETWLSSEGHTNMTGASAIFTAENGAEFHAWEGYISGYIIELIPQWKVVMKWRTTDFKEDDPYSIVTIEMEDRDSGCVLLLNHESIPDGSPDYAEGWKEHYFTPMHSYFGR